MTTNDHDPSTQDALPGALRWRLRGLRRDTQPTRNLWPDIAARIFAQQAQPQPMPRRDRRRGSRPIAWLAAAASVTLALGLGWQLRPASTPAPATSIATSTAKADDTMLVRQADAMAREYEAALRELEAARPVVLATGALSQLDRSAAEVRAALARDPDSAFLLDQLQRVYARRLSLTQRLV